MSDITQRQDSDVGLVVNWKFHKKNKWVSSFSPSFVNAFVQEFNPYIISNYFDYLRYRSKCRVIFSMEPGWAAPRLSYKPSKHQKMFVMYSDPHFETTRRTDFFKKNGFTKVLSFYKSPFFYHFKEISTKEFVHFPWAVADEYTLDSKINFNENKPVIFGGKNSPAYDVRNECRKSLSVEQANFSGVENKVLSDQEYFIWLQQKDAIVAAGSSDIKYDLVTPKYFEIASAGALLIGQDCQDLDTLGFNESNMLLFKANEFEMKMKNYTDNPKDFLSIREKGLALIKSRHLISHRMDQLKELFNE